MLVVNPHKLFPHLHRCSAEVNRPQLIWLNGRPELFPGRTQLLLLRHLLNCSLLPDEASGNRSSSSSKTNWVSSLGLASLSISLLTRVELLARSCTPTGPRGFLQACQLHRGTQETHSRTRVRRVTIHQPTNQPICDQASVDLPI